MALNGKGAYDIYTARAGCEAFDTTRYQEAVLFASSCSEVLNKLTVCSRDAVGISDGTCGQWTSIKTKREVHFPADLIKLAISIEFQSALASRASDKRHILNSITGQHLEAEPLAASPAYDDLKAKVRGRLVAAGWRQMLEQGIPMQAYGKLLAASCLRMLQVSFMGCASFTEEQAELFSLSLPTSLEELRAKFDPTVSSGRALLISSSKFHKDWRVLSVSL